MWIRFLFELAIVVLGQNAIEASFREKRRYHYSENNDTDSKNRRNYDHDRRLEDRDERRKDARWDDYQSKEGYDFRRDDSADSRRNNYLDSADKYGRTALHRAAADNDLDRVIKIVERALGSLDSKSFKRFINQRDHKGGTPLHYAVKAGCQETAKLGGKELENVSHEYAEIVLYLYRNGADINTKNEDGKSTIYWAVYYENPWILEILLENGAIVDKSTKSSEKYRRLSTVSKNRVNAFLRGVEDSLEEYLETSSRRNPHDKRIYSDRSDRNVNKTQREQEWRERADVQRRSDDRFGSREEKNTRNTRRTFW